MSPVEDVVLEATELVVEYGTSNGPVRALDSASLTVGAGEITALVGESGSGKSTLGLAVGRLLPSNATRVDGDLRVLGTSLYDCGEQALRAMRREDLGFVFQNPVTALDPTMRIGKQMRLAAATRLTDADLEASLESVGLSEVGRVLGSFPHELSGGMAQRVGIAMALTRRPRLLVADEPTAAVDATRRAQILELLVTRCRHTGCALLLLTHDLQTVTRWCSRIAVMYAGRIVEAGTTASVTARPVHPYTKALLGALPGRERPHEILDAIPGLPPVLKEASVGCAFAPRCPAVLPQCRDMRPAMVRTADSDVCCHLATRGMHDVVSTGRNGDHRSSTTARAHKELNA